MAGSKVVRIALLFAFGALAACGGADNATNGSARIRLDANNASVSVGDYSIHVNAILTADLTPEVAQSYGIQRSKNKGFVNLVVLSTESGTDTPVASAVEVAASNLTGQLKGMTLREIVDGPSIYYVGEVSVDDRETINFDFDVLPEGCERLMLIRYTHQFYTK